MTHPDPESVHALLALFSADTRLYELTLHPAGNDDEAAHAFGSGGLLVEGVTATEGLQAIGNRDLLVLSTNAHIALPRLVGCRATLHISLANGSRTRFAGLISEAALLDSEGSLARYRIRLVPWLWRLSQRRASRVWQDQSVIDIVDAVFAQYAPHAAWQWSSDARTFLADARPRSMSPCFAKPTSPSSAACWPKKASAGASKTPTTAPAAIRSCSLPTAPPPPPFPTTPPAPARRAAPASAFTAPMPAKSRTASSRSPPRAPCRPP